MWSILWVVCLSTDLCAQFNMVPEPQGAPLLLRSPAGSFFLAICSIPTLHQKQRVYHLIPQVKELLIKLSWLTMLCVMQIPKVQTVELILSVWLYDLQVISSSHCIHYKHLFLLTTFTTVAQSFSLHSKWLLQYRISFPLTTTSGRRTWRTIFAPWISSDSQWS